MKQKKYYKCALPLPVFPSLPHTSTGFAEPHSNIGKYVCPFQDSNPAVYEGNIVHEPVTQKLDSSKFY